ncbi:MAG TPA: hypothetical protein VF337_07015 [Candidatus Limnocylindrales bacterium]
MLHFSVKLLVFGFGALMFAGGLVAISAGGAAALSGIWAVGFGAAIMIATVLQRARYRSLAADRTGSNPGPGGGEIGRIDPRFAPTSEVFTDPTSNLVMRVYVDQRTGERRYLAEGRR